MQKIDFIPVTPAAMQPSAPFSTSDFIAARREKIFIPDAQTDFSFETNDRLTFTLNSTNEMIDGQNSWIEFDLTVVGAGDDLTANQRTQRIIDAGGAHALFRRLQVTLSNGTQIEDIIGYNKLYSIIRHNTISENHVRYVEAPLSGDGMVDSKYEATARQDFTVDEVVLGNIAAATYTAATGVVAALGATGEVLTQLKVGDTVTFVLDGAVVARRVSGTVVELISNQSFRISGLGFYQRTVAPADVVNLQAGQITGMTVARSGLLSARYRAGSTNAIKLKMKPFSNFFTNSKFVPLMFLKNLQITLELERGPLVFKFLAAPGANASITYTIKNPRLICSLITPSEPYLQSVLDAYNTPEGLYYPFLSFQGSSRSITNADVQTITIPANCRSAKAFIAAQFFGLSEGIEAASYVNDCISTTPKNRVSSFQVRVGSESFPFGRPVDTDDIFNGEALSHLQKALDLHGNISHHNSMIPSDYWAVNSVNGANNESKRFVMGVPLSRDISSSATGVDMINNDIQLDLTRNVTNDAAVNCYLRSWIIYDSALQISRMGTTVFK